MEKQNFSHLKFFIMDLIWPQSKNLSISNMFTLIFQWRIFIFGLNFAYLKKWTFQASEAFLVHGLIWKMCKINDISCLSKLKVLLLVFASQIQSLTTWPHLMSNSVSWVTKFLPGVVFIIIECRWWLFFGETSNQSPPVENSCCSGNTHHNHQEQKFQSGNRCHSELDRRGQAIHNLLSPGYLITTLHPQ